MDPERQQLLRPGQDGEVIKIIYGPDSIAFPASLHGKVPPDRFYHTMQRLNEAHGPMSRWTKFFIVALILLFIGILMPFAMLRWFTPRHFEVKMWIPIDGILIAINLGLGLLLYIRSRRIRSELAKIVKKENKVCYHRTGVHLRFEPGGMATRPSIVIEHTASTASDHAAYGSHQERQAPPPAHRGRAPPQSSRMPSTRLPSPPPFRQQHSFYELQQQNASPMPQQQPRAQSPPPQQQQKLQQQQQRPEFRSPPVSPRGYPPQRQQQQQAAASAEFQSGGPMSPRGNHQQHQQPNQRQPSPPMSPRYQQQYAGGPPPPSGNYAPQASAPPPSSYRPQPPSPGGGGFEGSPLTGHLATEFTSVPVRDSPSQRQHFDPTEGHYSPSPSPTPKKRSLAAGQNPPYSPARQQQQPPQQQQFYSPHQGDPRQAASPRSSAPYGQARAL